MIDRRSFLKSAGAAVVYSAISPHPRALAREAEEAAAAAAGVFATPGGARELAGTCLDLLRKLGAGYGDIRIGHYRRQSLSARDERLESAEEAESGGFGVRVLDRGAWGFAASNRLTAAE